MTTNPSPADFGPIATLEGLSGADSERLRLMEILTNPDNYDGLNEGGTREELYEMLDETESYDGYDHHHSVQRIAEILSVYNGRVCHANPGYPEFSFGFDCNASGEIDGFMVTATFGDDWNKRVSLAKWEEIKRSTNDRSASGRDSAVAIAEALDDTFTALVAKGRKRGLGSPQGLDLAAAAQALHTYDTTPSGDDVDVDTLAVMRDALAALLTAQGVEVQTAGTEGEAI